MEENGQKIWGSILSTLKSEMPASTFKTWFSGSHVAQFKQQGDKNILVVGMRNSFLKEQVEARYLPAISKVLVTKGWGKVDITFAVGDRGASSSSAVEPLFTGVAQSHFVNTRRREALNPTYKFGNFVVGNSNNIAFLCAKQTAENLAKAYNPFLVFGPTGVGKTHLLQAIGNEIVEKYNEVKVLYASSEKFTNDYIESLGNKTSTYFRQKYRNVDVLIIDDVHFLAGKESTQDEFFHTFNDLSLDGKQIILSSDRHPREIAKLKDRLSSRFSGGMAVGIGYPDVEMKTAIILQKCREQGASLDEETVGLLASSCEGGVRELEGMLIAVLAQKRLLGDSFGPDVVRSIVGNGDRSKKSSLTVGGVSREVSKYFKIEEARIRGLSRRAKVVWARQMLMYILRKELNLSLEAIGEFLGGRDHSTVIYGVEKMRKIIANNSALRDEFLRIREGLYR